jgi:nucleotide-binding universal stress UspA family protein
MFENRLRKAVFPLNLKEQEHKIISMAKTLSHFGTKNIILVHVKSGSNRNFSQAQEKLQTYAQKIQELGFETDVKIRFGSHIIQEICNTSMEEQAEFLCIVWKAKGLIKRTLLGSKTIDIIRLADLPIFVFKSRTPLLKSASIIDSIVYATEFKITDSVVIPYLNNRDITASKLILLHVGERAPDPNTENQRLDTVHANLNRLKKECQNCFQEVQTIEVIGSPKRQIVRQARKQNADLILIGKFDVTNPIEQIMGGNAEAIPFRAGCPVFIIPGIKDTLIRT